MTSPSENRVRDPKVRAFIEAHRTDLIDALDSHERHCENHYADMVFELSMKYNVDDEIVEEALSNV